MKNAPTGMIKARKFLSKVLSFNIFDRLKQTNIPINRIEIYEDNIEIIANIPTQNHFAGESFLSLRAKPIMKIKIAKSTSVEYCLYA